ncbi:PAS domain S-box protein [Methanoregula sp.]|uniref:PAS domain S-box protein n=1 Tax=Methanoregula sp. TaxID=2052170 RepID=UPI00237193CE|nr:PAS domain S-box protein [Methanoregula sp.]MDD1687438.1 PAS domain S-box protein [Methanoregula sp.]
MDIVHPPYAVLYVDDEPDLLEVAKEFLESSQEFAVDTRVSAKEALLHLKNQRYDAIVSDFQMPVMNGIAFLKEVRLSVGNVPFIIVTGRGREEVVIDALNNGADFYLQKGGDPDAAYAELIHVLRRAIQMRQAEISLVEQEQRYHDLQNATDLIQSIAPDGHFLFVNKKWRDTLQYREDELAMLTLFDLIHEESREHCRNLFPRVIGGEDVGIIDFAFRAKDGRTVYVEGFASCKIHEGKPQYTRGIFKDVTDRKLTESALRESENRFRTIFENSPYPIAINSMPDMKFVTVNAAFLNVSGYAKTEVLGKTPSEIGLLSTNDATRLVSRMGMTGRIADMPLSLKVKDGRSVHVFFSTTPVTISNQPASMTMILEVKPLNQVNPDLVQKSEEFTAPDEGVRADTEDLSQREHTKRENEEKVRMLAEESPDGILITDLTGMILFCNGAAANIFCAGSEPDRMRSANLLDFILPDARDELQKNFNRSPQEKECFPLNAEAMTISRRKIWIEGTGKRIVFANVPAIIISLRDISARKRMEDALRQTNKQLNLLSSITRHDVLNKVAIILGYIEITHMAGGPPPDYPKLFERIESSTRIIKSQMEFTRIYQNLGTKEPEWQKPVKSLARAHLPESIVVKNELGDLEIFADLLIEYVFQNLADNVVRHGGEVTEIRMESHPDPEGLTIVFEDNGKGVPAAEKEKIFKRGYGKHTGLGLFLAREILSITGITITETGMEGTGARFEIHVPDNAYRFTGTEVE